MQCYDMAQTRASHEGCILCDAGANAMALSLMKGKRVTLSKVDAFADGVAVKQASTALPDIPCRL